MALGLYICIYIIYVCICVYCIYLILQLIAQPILSFMIGIVKHMVYWLLNRPKSFNSNKLHIWFVNVYDTYNYSYLMEVTKQGITLRVRIVGRHGDTMGLPCWIANS